MVFLGDNDSYQYNHLTYSLSDNNPLHNYIMGLQPSTTYYLKLSANGGDLTVDVNTQQTSGAISFQTSANGVLYFSGSGTIDTDPPTVPRNLTASAASNTQINLSWNVSNDNVGVIGYKIYRNGSYLTSINTNSYDDT
jgi:hypothetical protein